MFGVEPELGREYGARYFERPSDERVNELFNEATVFVQTSIHEGFCLPLLEAMAAGTPVVSTDAHGNRDFCRHEENCLIADADPGAVAEALRADPRRRRAARAPGRRRPRDRGRLRVGAAHRRLESFFSERGRYSSSAIRGASRLNTQKPSARSTTTIAAGYEQVARPRRRLPGVGRVRVDQRSGGPAPGWWPAG